MSSSINDLLFRAIQLRDYEEARQLIADGADINHRDVRGETILLNAISPQTYDVAKWLLENGANPSLQSESKESPLHRAISVESPDLVKLLVDHSADPNSRDQFDVTPLMLTCVSESKKISHMVEILISHPLIDLDAKSDDGTTPLMAAAARSKVDVVTKMLEAGANPEAMDYLGMGLLHSAVLADQEAVVPLLTTIFQLAPSLDPNYQAFSGATPLSLLSSRHRLPEAIALLIDRGADPNVKQSNRFTGNITPLISVVAGCKPSLPLKAKDVDPSNQGNFFSIQAIASAITSMTGGGPTVDGNIGLVKKLLDSGAKVSARLDKGHNAGYMAVQALALDVLPVLVKAGLDPKRPLDVNGTSPYDAFSIKRIGEDLIDYDSQEILDIVEELYRTGFPFQRISWDESLDGEMTEDMLSALSIGDPQHPIAQVIISGNLNVAKKMISLGAKVDERTIKGGTFIHYLAAKDFDGLSAEHKKAIELFSKAKNVNDSTRESQIEELVKKGANFCDEIKSILLDNVSNFDIADKNGNTPLHEAARSGSESWASFLLTNGADPSIQNKDGLTPASIALMSGKSKLAGVLLEYSDSLDLKANQDKILLDFANHVTDDFRERMDILLGLKSLDYTKEQLECIDEHGRTPLMIAVSRDMNDLTRALLQIGADPKAVDKNGNNALMYASFKGSCENVKCLMSSGSDPSVKNNSGQNSFDVARHLKDKYLMDALESSPAPEEVVVVSNEDKAGREKFHESIKEKAKNIIDARGIVSNSRQPTISIKV